MTNELLVPAPLTPVVSLTDQNRRVAKPLSLSTNVYDDGQYKDEHERRHICLKILSDHSRAHGDGLRLPRAEYKMLL